MQSPVFLVITSPKPNSLDPPPRGTRVVESRSTNLMESLSQYGFFLGSKLRLPSPKISTSIIHFFSTKKLPFYSSEGILQPRFLNIIFKTLRFAILPGYVVVPKIVFIIFLLLTLLLKLSEGILQPRFSNSIFSEGILQPRFSNFFQNYFLSRFDP